MKISLLAPVTALLLLSTGCESVPSRPVSYGNIPSAAQAQAPAANRSQMELANLREDVRMLQQRVGELSLALEQLTRQNRDLQDRTDMSAQSYVTLAQMNQALSELSRSVNSASAEQRREIVQQVSQQIERLAKETQAALTAMSKGMAARPVSTPNFTDDYAKEGVTYTVQPGDSLSSIARRHNSSVRDIQNANRITDPTKIQVGQVLFIPQANN